MGIELPKNSQKKNEGIIISNDILFSSKKLKELKAYTSFQSIKEREDTIKNVFKKGTKIKFLEGIIIEDDLFFVYLDKIIGIYK